MKALNNGVTEKAVHLREPSWVLAEWLWKSVLGQQRRPKRGSRQSAKPGGGKATFDLVEKHLPTKKIKLGGVVSQLYKALTRLTT